MFRRLARLALLAAPAAALAAAPQPATPTLLISGGTVYDGTGAAGARLDVRIAGDRITEVAAGLSARPGERVIDASDRAVAPGFIDMHSHADGGLEEAPDALSQVRQGITTAIVGQDGGGTLPVGQALARLERARPAINVATSVGHGAVRALVMGDDFRRPATGPEIATMRALVERGMRDGALGLSSGLEYDPGFYATTDEVAALAEVAARFGGFYSSHVRDEEDRFADAWAEAIAIGRRTGIRVQISHMKAASASSWGRASEGLRALAAASAGGVRVMGDWYPYPYWQSSIYVLIPDRDFDDEAKWTLGLKEVGGAQNVLVTDYPADPSWNGRTLDVLARDRGVEPPALVVQMVRHAGPEIGVIVTSMQEGDMQSILVHPQVLICSDGQLAGRHPRGYGAFPRVLGRYVRELRVIPLEEAIAKMTGRSAAQSGLADRGTIAPGTRADVVVFDPATVADRGTPANPSEPPVGIETVIVNGEIVLEDGTPTGARPGRALRRAPDRP